MKGEVGIWLLLVAVCNLIYL